MFPDFNRGSDMESMNVKLIAHYLPQFHEIPENNDAWGNGFTEWVNVKKAGRIFENQHQPREPLNDNYYSLLDNRVMKWQAALAKEAGIYGFCLYHYWFNGRLVLEKPVRNLLSDPSVNLRYCFAWANEPWTKTWHGAGGDKEILIPQRYGREEEWERHYRYFLPYFRDDRYIKENNAPMLLIYRLRNIPEFNRMIRYWKERAVRDGFDGVFIVSMNVGREHVSMSRWVDASVDFEPNTTKYELYGGAKSEWKILDYDEICERMLKKPHQKNEFRSLFVDYDDTPRRGERGMYTVNTSPEKFGRYLSEAAALSRKEENGYLFLNAWNEWGEGNYLEPDKRWEYAYLREICSVVRGRSYAEKSNILCGGGECEKVCGLP